MAACSLPPDVGVLNMKTGEMKHPVADGGFRQIVVATNRNKGTFTTLKRYGNGLCLRTFDRNCTLVSQIPLPLFMEGYAGGNDIAVSDDLRRIVFADGVTPCNLYLLDTASGKTRLLRRNITDYSGNINLKWLDGSSLLVCLGQQVDTDRPTSGIFRYHVDSGVLTKLCAATYLSDASPDLTLDRSLAAFKDATHMHGIYGHVKVIDLRSGRLLKRLGSGKSLIGRPLWSPDGFELAYGEGKNLMIWNRRTDSLRVVATAADGITCQPQLMGYGVIAYRARSAWSTSHAPLVLRDSHTNAVVTTASGTIDGRIIRNCELE
jgi:hypothetical protein